MLKKIMQFLKHPVDLILYLLGMRLFWILPDKIYLSIKYRLTNKKKLNLKHPITLSEKMQWLKLYDRNPVYTQIADKYAVRNYIQKRIGDNYLIPLLGVYNSFDEIDFEELPDQFVLKPNHTSGDIYICTDKSKIDYKALKKLTSKWLKRHFYWAHREWPYKNIKPKLLCEKFLSNDGKVPDDLKVLCFHGKAKLIEVHTGRFDNHMLTNFTPDWTRTTLMHDFPPFLEYYDKPPLLEEMLQLSEQLAKDLIHIRVDWYIVDHKLYIGELTLYECAGFLHYENEVDDYIVGRWIRLPKKGKR
jgi:hypothetical protein